MEPEPEPELEPEATCGSNNKHFLREWIPPGPSWTARFWWVTLSILQRFLGSPCNPGWPGTCNPPASGSWVLRFQVGAITLIFVSCILMASQQAIYSMDYKLPDIQPPLSWSSKPRHSLASWGLLNVDLPYHQAIKGLETFHPPVLKDCEWVLHLKDHQGLL